MSYGLSMAGLDEQINDIADGVRRSFTPFTYMEIGVADGATLAEVAYRAQGGGPGWRAVGVELPNGYSFSRDNVAQNVTGKQLNLGFVNPEGWNRIDPPWNKISVVLCDVRDFFEGIWTLPVHLALIDACHCKNCVMRDFLNIEKYVPSGGIVMFHDFEARINNEQPFDHGPCDVLGACAELGVDKNERIGWNGARTLIADHENQGANMLVIKKI